MKNQKRAWLCLVILILGCTVLLEGITAPHRKLCPTDVDFRKDCGYPGISADECAMRNCCFKSKPPGVPWCFLPINVEEVRKICPVDVDFRKDCGYPGISADECAKRNCCFKSKPPGVPWCFLPISVEEGCSLLLEGITAPPKCRCDVEPHKRSNCGPPGITHQKCENSGCCFNSTVPGVPWCFKPTPPKYRKLCPTDVEFRKNCGYPGISADECAKRNCCFKSKPPGVPWCFFPINVEEEY